MKSKSHKVIISLLPALIIGSVILNLLLLDFLVIKALYKNSAVLGESTEISGSCPTSCIQKFSQYISSNNSTAKEIYIPLGAGSGFSNDWTDISGAQATIDSTQYRRIKKVTFEASVTVPTGNQSISLRLFNTTDKHPVWYSDVTMEGIGPTLLTSPEINLDPGNKVYQVQLKTQLGYPATLTQARIHILTN
jgi:hypothetical protein